MNDMPTILRIGRYQFKFFSNERGEPPHIHLKAGDQEAKFWLAPPGVASNYGFNSHELTEIKRIIQEYQTDFSEAWDAYFG